MDIMFYYINKMGVFIYTYVISNTIFDQICLAFSVLLSFLLMFEEFNCFELYFMAHILLTMLSYKLYLTLGTYTVLSWMCSDENMYWRYLYTLEFGLICYKIFMHPIDMIFVAMLCTALINHLECQFNIAILNDSHKENIRQLNKLLMMSIYTLVFLGIATIDFVMTILITNIHRFI